MEIIKGTKVTWVDIHDPDEADIAYLRKTYSFHPIVLSELSKETLRPKVDRHEGHFYLVLHFPLFDEQERRTYPKELDFIVTRDVLVTTHFAQFNIIDDFFQELKVNEQLSQRCLGVSTGYLLYQLITNLLNFSLRELDHIKLNIDKIEGEIFNAHQREMVHEISIVRRDIINFRRIILPQRSVLESLIETGGEYFGEEAAHYFSSLVGKYLLVWNHLENHKEAAEALQDTNESLLTTRANETIKTLTIIAAILLPLSLISQVFFVQLNSPFLEEASFWASIGVLATVAVALLAIFKKQKWL